MASWVLIPAAQSLFDAFDRIAPNRDHASDGSIGDTAHQQEASDHNPDETGNTGGMEDSDNINEVHAIDVDDDLNESDLTMEKCVQKILSYCRRNNSDPLNEPRLRYIIYNRRIWSASSNWVEKTYTGASAHTEHAHFSFEYGSGSSQSNLENVTTTWHLEEIPVALTDADKSWISTQLSSLKSSLTTEINAAPAETVTKMRQSQMSLSDTEHNFDQAVITKALVEGKAVKVYDNNVDRLAGVEFE